MLIIGSKLILGNIGRAHKMSKQVDYEMGRIHKTC